MLNARPPRSINRPWVDSARESFPVWVISAPDESKVARVVVEEALVGVTGVIRVRLLESIEVSTRRTGNVHGRCVAMLVAT